jgi:hypothetical protein
MRRDGSGGAQRRGEAAVAEAEAAGGWVDLGPVNERKDSGNLIY